MKIEKGILVSIESTDIKDGVLKLPKKVKSINYNVIVGFGKLTKIVGLGVTQIGDCNFLCCNALTSVEFPQLTQIGNYNFRYCNALTSVKFKNNSLKLKCVDTYPFVVESEKTTKGIRLYSGYNFDGTDVNGRPKIETSYVAEKDGFTAHGKTIKQAISDVQFKIIAEKLQNEPITPDTELTVMYYRTVTGACDFGCREFMDKNGIDYDVVGGRTVEKSPIKAKDLLPILEKSNAYGLERFKQLITF